MVKSKPGEKKIGRPARYEKREVMRTVSFRADRAASEALDKLTRAVAASGVLRPQSVAIRRALLDAAAKLDEYVKKPAWIREYGDDD